MTKNHTTPSIVLTTRDHERLCTLAAGENGQLTEVSRNLAQELVHARIVESTKVPPNIVTMHSRVTVREEGTGKTRVFTLVYPGDEDISIGNLSILTPAGAALIGLSESEISSWITRNSQTKAMTVIKVLYQPEASGRFDL